MTKQRWFENTKKQVNKEIFIIKFMKGSIIWIFLISLLSFFYTTNEIIYANKVNFLSKVFTWNLQTFYKNNFPATIWKLFLDYKNWKNILKEDKAGIIISLNKIDIFEQLLGLEKYKDNINKIKNILVSNLSEILKLLWEDNQKTYLIIFENTAEERANWWFFWSFAKIILNWWHIKNFKIYDSYYLLRKYCLEHTKNLPKNNWFAACNKSWLNLENNISPFNELFPKTTFLTSNIFWFDNLNWENIIKHYHKVFSDKIDWVIFVKSDILKYLIPNWQKILRDLEIINYKAKIKKEKINQNNKNLLWLKGVKWKYLLKINYLLNNKKKEIFTNFIKNFDKITKNQLIWIYIPNISTKLEQQLVNNNLYFKQNKNYTYIFFYNLGFNKNSHFVNHIVKINNKIYINPVKVKLPLWINQIHIKNIFVDNFFYEEYLEKNKIPKTSYLWSRKLDYKNLVIPQKNCKIIDKKENYYKLLCK